MRASSWRTIRVSELVTAGDAEIKTGPFGTQLRASDYVEHGTPVINVRNIGFGNIRQDKLEYITDETVARLASHVLLPGDIVFGRKGAVERHVLIQSAQSKWFQGSDCLRLRLKSNRVLPRFLSYYLLTSAHQQWMMQQCSHGATMASLNQDIVGRIEFLAPEIEEQRCIASILSAYDDLIENNTRRIAILEEMARRMYEEWFVRFRFPSHEGVRMVESELGLVPEGFRVGTVSTVAERTGRSINPAEAATEEFEHYSLPAFDAGQRPIVESGEGIMSNKLLFDDEVVLLSKLNPRIPRIWTVTAKTAHRHICSTEFLPYKPKAPFTPWLLYLLFSSAPFQSGYVGRAMGTSTSHQRLRPADVDQIEVLVPSPELVAGAEEIVAPMLRLCERLRLMNSNLLTTRDLLLPKLISGELDVSEVSVPEAIAA